MLVRDPVLSIGYNKHTYAWCSVKVNPFPIKCNCYFCIHHLQTFEKETHMSNIIRYIYIYIMYYANFTICLVLLWFASQPDHNFHMFRGQSNCQSGFFGECTWIHWCDVTTIWKCTINNVNIPQDATYYSKNKWIRVYSSMSYTFFLNSWFVLMRSS